MQIYTSSRVSTIYHILALLATVARLSSDPRTRRLAVKDVMRIDHSMSQSHKPGKSSGTGLGWAGLPALHDNCNRYPHWMCGVFCSASIQHSTDSHWRPTSPDSSAETHTSIEVTCVEMHRLPRPKHTPQHNGRLLSVSTSCSKGFGAPKQKTSKARGGKSPARTVEQAADLAEAAANRPMVRPINPKEAARGKVDYVQVKDWADGKAADLGELQVMPESYTADAYTAGGSSTSAAPFYQQLAHHAQYLESQGALSLALGPGAKPFLPFESWQYSLSRYRQYLAELSAVHEALEQALQLALAPPPAVRELEQPSTSGNSGEEFQNGNGNVLHIVDNNNSNSSDVGIEQHPAPWDVPGRSAAVLSAYAALGHYDCDCGLWRAAAAGADFAALLNLAAAHDTVEVNENRQQQHVRPSTPAHQEQLRLHASQNAVAYGRYLLQLGRSAAAATRAAANAAQASSSRTSSAMLVAEEDEGYRAVLKLIAHAYAVHVQQQCLGTRIGAAATEHLDLLPAGVSSLYLDYPDHIKEPVQHLVAVTDAAGRQLDADSKQVVFDELPKALNKATLILAPLATPLGAASS